MHRWEEELQKGFAIVFRASPSIIILSINQQETTPHLDTLHRRKKCVPKIEKYVKIYVMCSETTNNSLINIK